MRRYTLLAAKASLERGAHIIVGTPGRLIDHIEKIRLI